MVRQNWDFLEGLMGILKGTPGLQLCRKVRLEACYQEFVQLFAVPAKEKHSELLTRGGIAQRVIGT